MAPPIVGSIGFNPLKVIHHTTMAEAVSSKKRMSVLLIVPDKVMSCSMSISVALCTLPSLAADVGEKDLLFKNGFFDSNAIVITFKNLSKVT